MDKTGAIEIVRNYLIKIKNNNIKYREAYIFGSTANNSNNKDSDIDLAIVLSENIKSFDLDVKLMTLRTGEETLIEPHTFTINDFNSANPYSREILSYGIKM